MRRAGGCCAPVRWVLRRACGCCIVQGPGSQPRLPPLPTSGLDPRLCGTRALRGCYAPSLCVSIPLRHCARRARSRGTGLDPPLRPFAFPLPTAKERPWPALPACGSPPLLDPPATTLPAVHAVCAVQGEQAGLQQGHAACTGDQLLCAHRIGLTTAGLSSRAARRRQACRAPCARACGPIPWPAGAAGQAVMWTTSHAFCLRTAPHVRSAYLAGAGRVRGIPGRLAAPARRGASEGWSVRGDDERVTRSEPALRCCEAVGRGWRAWVWALLEQRCGRFSCKNTSPSLWVRPRAVTWLALALQSPFKLGSLAWGEGRAPSLLCPPDPGPSPCSLHL